MNQINGVGSGAKQSDSSLTTTSGAVNTSVASAVGVQVPPVPEVGGLDLAPSALVQEARAALDVVPPTRWGSEWQNFLASDRGAYRLTKLVINGSGVALCLMCHTDIGYQPSTSGPLLWGMVNKNHLSTADARELFEVALGIVRATHNTTEARAQIALLEAPKNLADAEWRPSADGGFECSVDGVTYLLYETNRGWFRRGERTLAIEYPTITDDLTWGVREIFNTLCESNEDISALYDKVQREVSPTFWQLIFG